MAAFEWFVFRPLNLEEFLSHFKVDAEQGKSWYAWWSDYYNHLAWRFYAEHYTRHKLLEFREFSRANSLRLKYPEELSESNDPEYYCDAWKQWKDESALLQEHRETMEPLLQQHSSPPSSRLLSEIVQEYRQMIEQGWTDQKRDSAKALWFNSNIVQPSANDFAALRSCPYPDYLKTSHWRRVRAAMLLIEHARCAACIIGDSFYGGDWETEIQVHHLHYQNRGHERYEDLRLLCKEHHDEAHSA